MVRTFRAKKRSCCTSVRNRNNRGVRRESYGVALSGAEVPTELVKVTETEPNTEVGPEMVNGTVSSNMLPFAWPVELSNQAANTELTGTEKVVVPVNALPAAAVKLKFAVVMSRVTE